MKKALLASAACAALGLMGAAAQAAIIGTAVNVGVPASASVTATGYHGYILHLATDDGANITAVDFSGTHGINGTLVQRWTASGSDGNYDTPTPGFSAQKNATASVVNFDSHFLLLPGGTAADFVVGSALTEDANIAASGTNVPPFGANTDSAGIGMGTHLQGAYGITGPKQGSALDMAYVVIPDSSVSNFDASGQVATTSGTFNVDIKIPEPATASLMGLAALGLVARRRRA